MPLRIIELALELALEIVRGFTPKQKEEIAQRWLNDTAAMRQDAEAARAWFAGLVKALKDADG